MLAPISDEINLAECIDYVWIGKWEILSSVLQQEHSYYFGHDWDDTLQDLLLVLHISESFQQIERTLFCINTKKKKREASQINILTE